MALAKYMNVKESVNAVDKPRQFYDEFPKLPNLTQLCQVGKHLDWPRGVDANDLDAFLNMQQTNTQSAAHCARENYDDVKRAIGLTVPPPVGAASGVSISDEELVRELFAIYFPLIKKHRSSWHAYAPCMNEDDHQIAYLGVCTAARFNIRKQGEKESELVNDKVGPGLTATFNMGPMKEIHASKAMNEMLMRWYDFGIFLKLETAELADAVTAATVEEYISAMTPDSDAKTARYPGLLKKHALKPNLSPTEKGGMYTLNTNAESEFCGSVFSGSSCKFWVIQRTKAGDTKKVMVPIASKRKPQFPQTSTITWGFEDWEVPEINDENPKGDPTPGMKRYCNKKLAAGADDVALRNSVMWPDIFIAVPVRVKAGVKPGIAAVQISMMTFEKMLEQYPNRVLCEFTMKIPTAKSGANYPALVKLQVLGLAPSPEGSVVKDNFSRFIAASNDNASYYGDAAGPAQLAILPAQDDKNGTLALPPPETKQSDEKATPPPAAATADGKKSDDNAPAAAANDDHTQTVQTLVQTQEADHNDGDGDDDTVQKTKKKPTQHKKRKQEDEEKPARRRAPKKHHLTPETVNPTSEDDDDVDAATEE